MSTLNLDNASLISSNSRSNFLGDGFNINRAETISIRGFIDNRPDRAGNAHDMLGVREVFGEITTMLANNEDYWTSNLIINGHDYGKGRVVSLEFSSSPGTKDNMINLGEYSATIEIYHKGDLDSWLGSEGGRFGHHYPTKTQMEAANPEYIRDFNFDASFNQMPDENQVTENFSISYLASGGIGDFDPKQNARTLATALLSHSSGHLYHGASNYGEFSFTSGSVSPQPYSHVVTGDWSEEYDDINLRYNFSRTMLLLPPSRVDAPYGVKHTRTLDFDQNGNIKVTEKGNVKGYIAPSASHASGAAWAANRGIEAEIQNSYTNCVSTFDRYTGFARDDINGGSLPATVNFPLNSIPIEVGRSIDSGAGVGDYTVTYTNNQRLSGLFINDWNQTASYDEENNIIIKENGTLREYASTINLTRAGYTAPKRPTHPSPYAVQYSTLSTSVENRSKEFYDKFAERMGISSCSDKNNLNLTNESMEYFFWGPDFTYSKTYSDDPSILSDADAASVGWKKVAVVQENTLTIPMSKEYLIPRQGVNGELVQIMGQMSLGTLTINVQASQKAPQTYFIDNAPPDAEIRNLVTKYVLPVLHNFPGSTKIKIREMWISDLTYSFNSDYDCNLVATANYTSENWVP